MKLELPLVVCHRSPRLVEAWLPHLGLGDAGPSLAALRDDLALQVMVRFEGAPAEALPRYQIAPHLRLRHVDLEIEAVDRDRRIRRKLAARLGVLLEKWPGDEFWLATPTRLPQARFALSGPDAVRGALSRRITGWVLDHDLDSLDPYHAARRERLDVLEVDADPPSVLPRTRRPRRQPARNRRPDGGTAPETPADREERRLRARLRATTLREATRDLSHGALDDTLERAFGREALVNGLVDDLLGRDGAAIVLVGASGVGKTAIVHEVTRRLVARQAAAGVRRDVWRIDGGRFIAGQSVVGQWEARARALCQELVDTGDLLFADDLASLVFAGRAGAARTNLAQVLEPHLGRGEISILGEATPERWERVREEAPGFAALFQVVNVPPLSTRETLPVLLGVLRELESAGAGELAPRLSPAALETLLDGAARFRPHEAFPGRAVRLLRRVLSGPGTPAEDVRRFDVGHVWSALRAETSLPDFILGAAPPRSGEDLRRELAGLVAGQPEAVDAIVDAVLAMQAGLGDPDKPLCTYLLVGPTGVGKTETANALARVLFGSPDRLLRFDMSEFSSAASLARFMGERGAPDGELTSALRAQPLRVILLDEIEKAHPRVFDALLQLLGEGRLTDAAGRTADARQAVILLTSNLGVREAAAQPGFAQARDAARQHYLSAVRAFFRPEFFNRIDRVVPFQPLDRAALRVVVAHALEDLLSRRGIRRGRVLVDVEPELLDLLVNHAFDPRQGARPLKRLLERRLTVPLARHLVTRRSDELALVQLHRGGDELRLSVRLLADAPPLVDEGGPATWRGPRLAEAVAELRARLEALAASRETGSASNQAIDLGELSAAMAELDDDALAGVAWVENVREASTGVEPIGERDRRARHAGHMGLRPRPRYVEAATHVNEEALLRRLRPIVSELRDRLTIAEHQQRAIATGGIETGVLLLECVGAVSREALEVAATLVPGKLLHAESWEEVSGEDGSKRWRRAQGLLASHRRLAVAVSSPGLSDLIAPLVGWCLVEIARDGVPVTVPVRVSFVPGAMPDAIAAHDARAAAERVAPQVDADVVIARRPGACEDTVEHVATGLPAREHLAILAAWLLAGGHPPRRGPGCEEDR